MDDTPFRKLVSLIDCFGIKAVLTSAGSNSCHGLGSIVPLLKLRRSFDDHGANETEEGWKRLNSVVSIFGDEAIDSNLVQQREASQVFF